MRTFNQKITVSQACSVSFNSPPVPLKNIYTYSVAMIVTGTPTGTVKLQASNDPETNDTQTSSSTTLGQTPGSPPAVAPSNWADITNSSFSLTTGGETMWNVNAVGYNFVRVVYTDGSGGTSAATASIIFNGKGV